MAGTGPPSAAQERGLSGGAPGRLPQFDRIAQVLAGEDARIGAIAERDLVNAGGIRGASRVELDLHLGRAAIANGDCDRGALGGKWRARGAPDDTKYFQMETFEKLTMVLRRPQRGNLCGLASPHCA